MWRKLNKPKCSFCDYDAIGAVAVEYGDLFDYCEHHEDNAWIASEQTKMKYKVYDDMTQNEREEFDELNAALDALEKRKREHPQIELDKADPDGDRQIQQKISDHYETSILDPRGIVSPPVSQEERDWFQRRLDSHPQASFPFDLHGHTIHEPGFHEIDSRIYRIEKNGCVKEIINAADIATERQTMHEYGILTPEELEEAERLEEWVEKQLNARYKKDSVRPILVDMGLGSNKVKDYVIKRFTGWHVNVNELGTTLYPFTPK